jgi:hypothetical protein
MRRGNLDDQAPRASRADWDASVAKLQQRMASTQPSPGTRLEPVSPEDFRKTLDRLGAFAGMRFVKVSQTGWDLFEARFAYGALEIAVAPLSPSGKFAGESYRLK